MLRNAYVVIFVSGIIVIDEYVYMQLHNTYTLLIVSVNFYLLILSGIFSEADEVVLKMPEFKSFVIWHNCS